MDEVLDENVKGKKQKESIAEEQKEEKTDSKEEAAKAEDIKISEKILQELKEKLQKAEEENAALKDSLLRKQAEFENYRKRMIREKEETVKYGNSNLLIDLVNIIDDFERAINSAGESKDFDKFYQGIGLIEKQFTSMLEKKWNLVRFDSAGLKFDPERHEAFMMEEKAGIDEPVVAEVFQNGYILNNRVIRNARVKVFMPAEKTGSPSCEEKADDDREKAVKE